MGRAAAIAFAREGADVAINYLPAEEADAQEVTQLVLDAGRKGVTLPGDIRDERTGHRGQQCRAASLAEFHPRHLHGAIRYDIQDQCLCHVLDLKAAVPHLQPRATTVVTTSVNAYEQGEDIIDYAATKGDHGFCEGPGEATRGQGHSGEWRRAGPSLDPVAVMGGQPIDRLPEFGANTPMDRSGQPVELAPLYVLLASDESSDSTGQFFGAAGGRGGR
jgi:NAD(P)-dependent dehydrogenase (short-subunit alcohol dehydrogenase family)